MSFAFARVRMFIHALGARTRGERARFRRDPFDARHHICRGEQIEHARVSDAVVHAQAILAILDQSGLAEKHQLLRDVRLALPKERSQMTHALFPFAQRVEQP